MKKKRQIIDVIVLAALVSIIGFYLVLQVVLPDRRAQAALQSVGGAYELGLRIGYGEGQKRGYAQAEMDYAIPDPNRGS